MDRGRTNLYEELGRVEGESSNRNRRDEVSRIHSELNRGYKKGGRVKSRGVAKRGFGKEVRYPKIGKKCLLNQRSN